MCILQVIKGNCRRCLEKHIEHQINDRIRIHSQQYSILIQTSNDDNRFMLSINSIVAYCKEQNCAVTSEVNATVCADSSVYCSRSYTLIT